MEQGRFSRIAYTVIGAIIVIVLALLVIWGISKIVSSFKDKPVASKGIVLSDYAGSDAILSYKKEGIINASELHRSVVITVGKNSRTIEQVDGYQGQVVKSQSYSNNTEAFKAFLEALQRSGYLIQQSISKTNIDGKCPLGYKYTFINSGLNNAPEQLWTTSCGLKDGTFGGNFTSVQRLFQLQIPDYDKFVSNISFSEN